MGRFGSVRLDPFYVEKTRPGYRTFLAYPRFLMQANFSYIFLQNMVNRLREKQKSLLG